MNTLTVNLHLLMASFYRPSAERFRIVIEDAAFPSDSHAVASQVRLHGFDPADRRRAAAARARARRRCAPSDVTDELERLGGSIALVLLGGVNYLTGELFEIPEITAAAHATGALVGWDLAHAVGNVPLELRRLGRRLGRVVPLQVRQRRAGRAAAARSSTSATPRDASLPRLAGWWGNDPATRFRMEPELRAPGRAPSAGRSRRRRCSRSRRCARRSSSSTPPGCPRCASARCDSPGTSSRCSTSSSPSAARRSSRRATRRGAGASSRSPFPMRVRSRSACGPSTA